MNKFPWYPKHKKMVETSGPFVVNYNEVVSNKKTPAILKYVVWIFSKSEDEEFRRIAFRSEAIYDTANTATQELLKDLEERYAKQEEPVEIWDYEEWRI